MFKLLSSIFGKSPDSEQPKPAVVASARTFESYVDQYARESSLFTEVGLELIAKHFRFIKQLHANPEKKSLADQKAAQKTAEKELEDRSAEILISPLPPRRKLVPVLHGLHTKANMRVMLIESVRKMRSADIKQMSLMTEYLHQNCHQIASQSCH